MSKKDSEKIPDAQLGVAFMTDKSSRLGEYTGMEKKKSMSRLQTDTPIN